MVDWLKAGIIQSEQRIEPPTKGRVERLVKNAIASYENNFRNQTFSRLTPSIIEQIDILLSTEDTEDDESVEQSDKKIRMSDFAFLKNDPGAVGLDSFLTEIKKLKLIRAVGLPPDLFRGISEKLLKTY